MSYLPPPTSSLKSLESTETIDQGAMHGKSQQSPRTGSINILDDDSLLNIFYLYRPAIFDGDEEDDIRAEGGMGWDRERWWYKPAQVCRRWRNIILGSASHLGLCLLCTFGTPVADMLAHSPPFPLVIDYFDPDLDLFADEGITLALEHRDRLRRVRIGMPVPIVQKLITAIDEECPVLEYLIMVPSAEEKITALILPETFQAPHLRHLALSGFALPIGCRLLTTAVGLVTLALSAGYPSAYFHPDTLLQWVSFMPQLETLLILFLFPVPNRDVEKQLTQAPIITQVTLPNLRVFEFQGASSYMESVVRRIATPRLEKLTIQFFNQLTFFIPHLQQFVNTAESLRFDSARFLFSRNGVDVEVYPPNEDEIYSLTIFVCCWHLDWQVSSVAQIFSSLSQIFSTVEHLTFEHKVHGLSSEEHNEVDRTKWRKLLTSFSNVKTLHIGDGLVQELSRSLRLYDEEHPLDLLPELQELTYDGKGDTDDVFTSFIDAYRNAGRLVTLTRY